MNNCPFKQNTNCTYKRWNKSIKSVKCTQKDPLKCPYYIQSLTKLKSSPKMAVNEPEAPSKPKMRKLFFKYCRKCGYRFDPVSREQTLCENCHPYSSRIRVAQQKIKSLPKLNEETRISNGK